MRLKTSGDSQATDYATGPAGEKKQAASNRLTFNTNGLNQPLNNIRQPVEEIQLSGTISWPSAAKRYPSP